jgi:hypothetical protein
MSSQFRATSPTDAESISRLMRQVFDMAANHPGLTPEQMHWKYWQDCPGWVGSRSFVMEREREIVAHGSVVPLTLASPDSQLNLVYLIDWAARADCPGAGIALLKRIGDMVDGVFVAGGSESTQKILPALGFKDVGTATRFCLPLRLLARFPDTFRSSIGAARFARNLVLATRRGKVLDPPEGWHVRRLHPHDLNKSSFPTPTARTYLGLFLRSVPAIAYLLRCPVTPAEFYAVECHGLPRGYFVLTIAGKQSRLAEAWIDSDEVMDWQALYALAVQRARLIGSVAELEAVASTPQERQALQQSGFPAYRTVKLRLWLRKGEAPPVVRYQMVDGDAAFQHDGN